MQITDEELRIDSVNPAGAEREPVHIHPVQESGCEVVSGSLVWEVDGVRQTVSAGERVTVPAGTPHRFWNEGPGDALATQFMRPALESAAFFESLFALAQRGEIDDRGMPHLLPLAAMVSEFGDEIRPVSPPWPVLRVLAAILGPLARRRGHTGRLELPG